MAPRTTLLSLAAFAAFAALLAMQPLSAQPPLGRGAGFGGGRGGGPSDTDTRVYNKRDFSGLWSRSPEQYELTPCPECRDPASWPGYGFFGDTPPLTPEGQRRFEENKPARGIELGTEEAARRTDIHAGYRRAVLPAFGNDPEMRCEPLGLARLITFAGIGAAMEIVQTDDRLLQLFEWTWDFRDIGPDRPWCPAAAALTVAGWRRGR
jgi:hypothetical protein